MAVVIETTLGDITVDLYLEQRPVTCLNFLKLCKMKYYNFNLFHTIRNGFIAQTGDPTGEGSGGQSVFGILEGPDKRFFSGEKLPKIRHTDTGLLSMVGTGDMMIGSQFFFTLGSDLDSLDGLNCVIGEVTEGHEILRKLNDVICDENHRPYRDVRITHTVVLEDPFNNPPGLMPPSRSPSPSAERLKNGRIAPDEDIDEVQGKSAAEVQEMLEEKEAKARATILEIIGDIPDADIAPPENVLFVCKLNPVTTDEDLEIIFSRFGEIVSSEVIRDKKTGDSLQYAFIEFADKKSCENAYFKMDNVLIDDRRIHVDFSQSVSKMRWLGKGRGVKYFDEDNNDKGKHVQKEQSRSKKSRSKSRTRDKHNNSRRHQEKEERHRQERRERDTSRHRERSRSRSKKENSRSDRNHNSRNYENDKHRENSSHKSRSRNSPSRDKSDNRYMKGNDKSEYSSRRDHTDNGKNRSIDRKNEKHKNESNNRHKHKNEDKEIKTARKKSKAEELEPRTPSPVIERRDSDTKKSRKKAVKKTVVKKKRKPSTSSSDSDSSDSSVTSSSSSSSEDRRKKRTSKRKRKNESSSSSSESSESSSSSTSSSSTDSSSTSSSSDSEPSRKKRKKGSKRVIKKAKK